MALGIHNDGIHTVYEIPLNSSNDKHWNDRSWLVEHLRLLADKLEETKFEVYTVGIEMNSQYKTPTIVIKGCEYKEDVLADLIDNFGTKTGLTLALSIFQGFTSRRKWEMFERMKHIEWCCPNCGNPTGDPKSPFMGTIQCGHCDTVLSHRTNGGQNNPFNWVYRKIIK